MSFSLVGPFAFGAKVSSTQFNQLDTDHANALDKTVAGDTLSGTITMTSTGIIDCGFINNIQASASGAITSYAAGAITSTVAGGISAGGAGGISDGGNTGGIAATVAGGISDGGIAGGIQATVAGGITSTVLGGITPGVAGGIKSAQNAGILVTVFNGLQTTAKGGIVLNAGAGDYITYGTAQTTVRVEPCGEMFVSGATNWGTDGTTTLVSLANSGNLATLTPRRLLNGKISGATLSLITLYLVAASHSGVPATAPTLNMQRLAYPGGSSPTAVSLFSTGAQSFWPTTAIGGIATPASGSAWTNGGNLWAISFAPDQNNVIDLTAYGYQVLLYDEQGTNAATGNFYYAIGFTFAAIANTGL